MSQDRINLPVTYAKPIPALATVRAYLKQHGYTLGEPIMRGDLKVWETWHLAGGLPSGIICSIGGRVDTTRPIGPPLDQNSIDLPCLSDARDFPQRMHEFLQELARLEGYNQTGPLYDAIVQTSFPVGVIGP
jgi:hypothetical protein